MLLFWSGAAMLCILAIAFVIWPLYSRGQVNVLSRNKLNVELFHNRLTELEQASLTMVNKFSQGIDLPLIVLKKVVRSLLKPLNKLE